ncbi:MAG: response regulator [Ignavibacteria bacterium]|nr:response regulator [Ignavibacteria bacterium]
MSETNSASKPRILYVEDHLEAYSLVEILLNKYFELIQAESPEQAFVKLNSEKVDLILLDIALKEKLDGLKFLTEIKANEKFKHLPVLVLTAYALHGEKELFMNEGADDYVAKPFNKLDLVDKINKLIK